MSRENHHSDVPPPAQESARSSTTNVDRPANLREPSSPPELLPDLRTKTVWKLYLATVAIVAVCGLLGWGSDMLGLAVTNTVMIFLAGVVFVAARFGRGPAILAAVTGVLVLDFLFIPPYYAFARHDTQYVITLLAMLGTGLLISELTARLGVQLRASQRQERRMGQLYQMTQQLSKLVETESLVRTAGLQVGSLFTAKVVLYLCQPNGSLKAQFESDPSAAGRAMNEIAAHWAARFERIAGLGTDTLPNATALLVPMVGSKRIVGVLGVVPSETNRFLDPEELKMLSACASLIALSIERDQSLVEAQQAQLQVQTEQLRNSLLSSVSHDLRTPLAMIAVTASSLLENSSNQGAVENREMLKTLVEESHRLTRQVNNLLDMAQLNSGMLKLNREWQVLEELVGVALTRLRRELDRYRVSIHIPDDFPLLWIADDLVVQLFVNLLENAVRYTPHGSQIEITATRLGEQAEIRVSDNGPGLPPGCEAKVFDQFFRGSMKIADGQRGIGLGLTICRAIVEAHGGEIRAANRPTGGAEFTILLPCPSLSPQVTLEETTASERT